MRAAIFKGPGHPLQIEAVDDLIPSADGVVVKVGRSGICTSDLHFTDGQSAKYSFSTGSVFGHEVAGEIVEVGRDVADFRPGDKVACMPIVGCGHCQPCLLGRPVLCSSKRSNSGGYAQYVQAYQNGLIRLPQSLSFADGALIEPLAVALHGVSQCAIRPGSRVLVLGAGPIGLGAVFWAKRLGASRVVVSEINRSREDLARSMGADGFIVASESERSLEAQVSEAMSGPADVVLECVGLPGMLNLAIDCLAPAGTIGVIGFCMVADSFVPADAIAREARMIFSSLYNLNEYEHVARTLDAGAVEPRAMISRTICLHDLPQTFEQLRTVGADVKVHVDPHGS